MNILLFVTALLMMLSVLTYTKVESFANYWRVHRESTSHLHHREAEVIEEQQCMLYSKSRAKRGVETVPALEEEESETNKSCPKPPPLNSYFDIGAFFNSDAQETPAFATIQRWLKALMEEVYGHAFFLREALEEDPAVLDRLLDELARRGANIDYAGNIKNIAMLATVDLGDEQLQELLYHMLRGNEGEEGYLSLKIFTRIGGGSAKLSVYLAPSQMLKAIYRDEDEVQRILAMRKELHRKVKNKSMSKEEASAEFKALYDRVEFEGLLEFGVTSSKPR